MAVRLGHLGGLPVNRGIGLPVRFRARARSATRPDHRRRRGVGKNMAENKNTAADESFYDEATESFPSVDDLVPHASSSNPDTIGRLVAIWAISNGTAKGESGNYGYTESLTFVLDDGPGGDQFTDLIPEAPQRLNLRHSTMGIHSRLAPRVEGKNRDGVPLRFRPYIGRVNTKASTKYKKGSPAVSISALTDEDKVIVQGYRDAITAINQELEKAAEEKANQEAFE